jgi:hypothetical protein
MKQLLLAFFSWISFSAVAQQGTMVFFTEDEAPFYLVVNGIQQNLEPMTNVRLIRMNAPAQYRIRIRFADSTRGLINDRVTLDPGMEKTWRITPRVRKGQRTYVVRAMNETPLPPDFSWDQPRWQGAVPFHEEPWPNTFFNEDPRFNVQIGPGGVNMQLPGGQVVIGNQPGFPGNGMPPQQMPMPNNNWVPGYNGPFGCPMPMNNGNFLSAKQAIQAADFEDTKLSTARTIMSNNCLTTDQVIQLCRLFEFEDSKLEFAKYAFARTYDRGNYFRVNTVFEFDASREELNAFIQSGRR